MLLLLLMLLLLMYRDERPMLHLKNVPLLINYTSAPQPHYHDLSFVEQLRWCCCRRCCCSQMWEDPRHHTRGRRQDDQRRGEEGASFSMAMIGLWVAVVRSCCGRRWCGYCTVCWTAIALGPWSRRTTVGIYLSNLELVQYDY